MIRSRSGALVAVLFVSTLATGVLQIAVPLELRQLRASPGQIGIALSMFGLGMFLFEWVWGVLADRIGYQIPLIASQLLYAAGIFFLARADSVPAIAIAYLLASGMMVAVIVLMLVGVALSAMIWRLQAHLLRWQQHNMVE